MSKLSRTRTAARLKQIAMCKPLASRAKQLSETARGFTVGSGAAGEELRFGRGGCEKEEGPAREDCHGIVWVDKIHFAPLGNHG